MADKDDVRRMALSLSEITQDPGGLRLLANVKLLDDVERGR
jgi:hypothetical protein